MLFPQLKSDEMFVEAILGVFVVMVNNTMAAEALLVNGLLQTLSLPLSTALDFRLNPAPLSSQVSLCVCVPVPNHITPSLDVVLVPFQNLCYVSFPNFPVLRYMYF